LADDRTPDEDALDARIAAATAADRARSHVTAPARGYSQGSRVLAELIGAPAGGALIGWLIDKWLGTSPWALLILLALATIVAFRNIMRISKERAQ
jgi:ATP synthase protein I